MYYTIKLDLRTYACFSLLSCDVAILDAILNNSKCSIMPAGRHSDSDSTLLPLPKSAVTWFGGIFARLTPLAAGLHGQEPIVDLRIEALRDETVELHL